MSSSLTHLNYYKFILFHLFSLYNLVHIRNHMRILMSHYLEIFKNMGPHLVAVLLLSLLTLSPNSLPYILLLSVSHNLSLLIDSHLVCILRLELLHIISYPLYIRITLYKYNHNYLSLFMHLSIRYLMFMYTCSLSLYILYNLIDTIPLDSPHLDNIISHIRIYTLLYFHLLLLLIHMSTSVISIIILSHSLLVTISHFNRCSVFNSLRYITLLCFYSYL